MPMSARRPPNRRIFANRMSIWFTRSLGYSCPAVSRLTVVVPVVWAPGGTRPSSDCTSVLGTAALALSDAPLVADVLPTRPGSAFDGFSERNCALTSTSIFGRVYAADPRTEVSHGSVTSQPRGSGLSMLTTESQVLRTPRPVVVPPCNMSPPRRRAVADVVTPCQY